MRGATQVNNLYLQNNPKIKVEQQGIPQINGVFSPLNKNGPQVGFRGVLSAKGKNGNPVNNRANKNKSDMRRITSLSPGAQNDPNANRYAALRINNQTSQLEDHDNSLE